ncbi:hypothetical protein ACL90Y_07945 [Micrococcus luteus]
MTKQQHHTTPEEWEELKAAQARDDSRWRRRRKGSSGIPTRTIWRDVWDWVVGLGCCILAGALLLLGAATISNTLNGQGPLDSDVGSYAICGAAIAVGLWLGVIAVRRWNRSGV